MKALFFCFCLFLTSCQSVINVEKFNPIADKMLDPVRKTIKTIAVKKDMSNCRYDSGLIHEVTESEVYKAKKICTLSE